MCARLALEGVILNFGILNVVEWRLRRLRHFGLDTGDICSTCHNRRQYFKQENINQINEYSYDKEDVMDIGGIDVIYDSKLLLR